VSVGGTCSQASPVCFATGYTYPVATSGSAETGPDYGCVNSSNNPAWFYIQIQDSGTITYTISTSPSKSIRFVLWGPFTTPSNCGASLSAAKIIDCANNPGSGKSVTINNAKTGEYYVFVILNPSGNSSDLSFTQNSPSGSTNCDILCSMTGITATAGSCSGGDYIVTGTLTTFLPPGGGTLTVSSSCGNSVVYTAPFSTSKSYALPAIGGMGDTCTITAVYSNNVYCNKSTTVIAPSCCSISTPSTATVCAGQTLSLTATGTSAASYQWSGPNSFTSTQQNPTLSETTNANAGIYNVYLTLDGCTTPSKSVTVTVKAKPIAKSISHR
ncbi:MAG: immunoglobulin domain-containing protein, partial [Bacteroidota bacterium]